MAVSPNEATADIVACLGNYIKFNIIVDPTETVANEKATMSNAFTIMMAAQRSRKSLPDQYTIVRDNQKICLKNDIIKWLGTNDLGWTPDTCKDQGRKFVETLADALIVGGGRSS